MVDPNSEEPGVKPGSLHIMLDVSHSTTNPFTAKWLQTGDKLCLGHWEITYQGRALEVEPPRGIDDMGTHGIFSRDFPEDQSLAEGLPENEWVLENIIWVTELFARYQIPVDANHMHWFYRAINAEDWRCGNCKGCDE